MGTLLKRIGCDEYKIGDPGDPANDWWLDVSRDKECRAIAAARGIGNTPSATAFENPEHSALQMNIEIENDVKAPPPNAFDDAQPEPTKEAPVFFEPPAKKPRKAAVKKAENPRIVALKEVGFVVRKKGDVQNTHVRLVNTFACAHNGLTTIGLPFGFDFDTVVSHQQLLDACKNSGDEFAATQLDDGGLSVVSGELTMRVAPGARLLWNMPNPDAQIAPATDRLRTALVEAATFASDSLARPDIAGLMLQGGSVVGVNGHGIVEAWHGIDMPPNQRIPVSFAKTLARIKREIVGFGFSDVSFTVWFKDGGFIRTAKHQPDYVNWQSVIVKHADDAVTVKLPESFFKALDIIRPFCRNDHVYFVDGAISSRIEGDDASTYRISALPFMGFDVKLMKALKSLVTEAYFKPSIGRMEFVGDQVRGAIMSLGLDKQTTVSEVKGTEYVHPETGERFSDWDDYDDDIPF